MDHRSACKRATHMSDGAEHNCVATAEDLSKERCKFVGKGGKEEQILEDMR